MDKTKDYSENCELHLDDGKQYETSELKQENQSSNVTVHKKETVEGDENGRLLRHEEDPEVLEPVHKYANIIKSFLGWEPNFDEQENKKERGKSSSEAADDNKVSKVECGSLGDSVNKEKDYDSLKEEEKDKSIAQPQESELLIEAKPDTHLQTDHTNDCQLSISPKPEAGETDNEEIIPVVEDAHKNSISSNNLPGDDVKQLSSSLESPKNESESDIIQSNINTPEMELDGRPDLESSFGNVPKDVTNGDPVAENKVSDEDLEKVCTIGEEEREQILISDLEIDVSKEKEVHEKDKLNNHSEPMICSTNVDKDGRQENGSYGENLCETGGNGDPVHLYENSPHGDNFKKPYMDEIRRLSIDIVKEVIESARNSVHEMIVNKSDQDKIIEDEIASHVGGPTTYTGNGSKNLEAEGKYNVTNQPTADDPSLLKISTESKDNGKLTKDLQNHKECVIDEETLCGFGSFRPPWIQKYATPKTFLLFFSLVGIINGGYYTYNVSIMSTLEKRFSFKSKVSGIVLLSDEIPPLILGVIVGYFGGKTHRPRMVAIGMFMSATCCFISGIPYLIYGPAKQHIFRSVRNVTGTEVCDAEVKMKFCDSDDRPPTMTVVGIFLLASILKGFGTLSYYVIGMSYMDDITSKKNTPLYFAVALALRLLGPLVGFLMSSAFLKIFEDPFQDPGYGPDDPRWIGAWWMGFFLQGVLLVIFTLPIALFPRRLPSQRTVEKFSSAATSKKSFKETLKGLGLAVKRLGKNPIYVLVIINTTMKIFGHFGHSIMLPKYMENQFRLSAADASLFSGASTIICIILSTLLGGFLIWKYRPRIKLLLIGMVTSEIILCLGFLILMIPRCQPVDMLHFGMNDEGLILDSVCNQNCDCSTTSFTPFCGPDGKTTYFSPCYAGCTQELASGMLSKKQMAFGNCSCVSVPSTLEPNSGTITEGFCPDENCWSKALAYLIILFILLTISNTLTVAHTMILLRSVLPGDKTVALGAFETFICLFGFIPCPVAFGAVVDSACIVWEKSCEETGNCWFYDMEKYRYLLHGAAAIFCFLSTMCLITMYCLSSRVRDLYAEDDEVNEYIDNIKLDTVSGSVTKL